MEQLLTPKAIIDTAIQPSEPIILGPQLYPVKSDPARAWLRLTEVQVPASAPVRTLTDEPGAAAIDLLRSRLMRQLRKEGLKRLAITAPTHGCGTTMLAASLALSLSKRLDLKVILFDMNLRSPQLAHLFGLTHSAPPQSALAGVRAGFDTHCMRIGHNLGLSLSSHPELSPAELLGTSRSRALIEQVEQEFAPDLMIFDMPPVLPNDDVVAAADLYDAALLVARADHSRVDQIDRAERLISEQKPCLGVVMNACRFPIQSELGNERTA